jgi:CHAT domain-containing protein
MSQPTRIVVDTVECLIIVAALCLAGAAQQATAPESPISEGIAKAREALKAAESAHPGNTVEVADAIENLVQKEIDTESVNAETLPLVMREAEVAKAAAGPNSKTYVVALGMISDVYTALSRPADGRPFAEQGLAIAEKEFPGTEDYANAADELAAVCNMLGDYPSALRAEEAAIATERKVGGNDNWNLTGMLNDLANIKIRMRDRDGTGAAFEESLAITLRTRPNDPFLGVIENNIGSFYVQTQQFEKAIPHLAHAVEIGTKLYGPNSGLVLSISSNLANLYSRTGQFDLAWKNYELTLSNQNATVDSQAQDHAVFSRSLASGGSLTRAISEGLIAARMGRESFVLQARTLPERQALAYDAQRTHGVDTAISVLLKHPEIPVVETYQEVVRARAIVADEMARRQKNLNSSNDPAVGSLLSDLNKARAGLLAVESAAPAGENRAEAVARATAQMEKIERALAERSATVRSDERIAAVRLGDLRQHLPKHSILISYVEYSRRAVEQLDPSHIGTPSYMAFVVHPDSSGIRIFDLGAAKPIEDLVSRARATADEEAHGGGLGSTRNERNYREAAEALRKLIWDPLRGDLKDVKLALVVPDGVLNLIPFSSLPDGTGYLVEHGPVIHILSSERDLVPAEAGEKKAGLLAVGSPQFDLAGIAPDPSRLRDAPVSCEDFTNLQFHPLPGSGTEVADIASTWRRSIEAEPASLLTGADATRSRFIEEASRNRVLHVATHAFFLDKACGNGNPLLHSGLVFAGANASRDSAILTAQQVASLDLSGVDWAVLSACSTGNGELRDGEGVLGLQRAFRIAGARSVVMTLWPVDDEVTGRFMHVLYADRFVRHDSTADALWNSARKLLLERRAEGKSTHPWYWAGFVGSGGWE